MGLRLHRAHGTSHVFKHHAVAFAASQMLLLTAVGFALAAAADTARAQAQPGVKAYAIPAGPLEGALARFAQESGVMLSYNAGDIAGKRSPGLAGSHAVPEALGALLAGTGLSANLLPNGGYTLRLAPAVPQQPGDASPAAAGTLAAVTVTASVEAPGALPRAYAGGQVARGTRIGMLGNVDFMDAPVSIASYTEQVIRDQNPRTVGELLGRNDASVRFSGGEGESTESLQVRGFSVSGGSDLSLNGLPGIVAQYRSAADFVERVEILKGPGAMVGGMAPGGSIGGTVNLVTKRADDEPLTRLTGSYLSDSRVGVQADVGRRFGEDKRWGLRVNGSLRDGDTPRDWQSDRSFVGSVALDYRGERLRASLDLIRQESRQRGSRGALGGVAAAGVLPRAPDGSVNLDQPWAVQRNDSNTVMGRVEYDFTKNTTAWFAIGQSSSDYDTDLSGNVSLSNRWGNYSLTGVRNSTFGIDTRSMEAGVRGEFSTGPISHRWVISGSHLHRETGVGSLSVPGNFGSNVYAPVVFPRPTVIGGYTVPITSELKLPSLALADTLSFADDRVLLTLGLRRQKVESANFNATSGLRTASYEQSANTPFFGLVVKPWQNISLYVNRAEGLTQGASAPATAENAGDVFPPFKSRQTEVGAKFDLGRLAATVALFQIEKPSATLGPDNYFRVNGIQRNRGLELSLFGELMPDLRLLTSATLLDAKVTKTPTGANEGNRAIGVPRLAANLGLEWDLPTVSGLTLIGNVTYTGKTYIDLANIVRAPSWHRVDLGVRYRTQAGGHPLLLRAGVENVFDKNYWSINTTGGATLSMPRTFVLSATVDF